MTISPEINSNLPDIHQPQSPNIFSIKKILFISFIVVMILLGGVYLLKMKQLSPKSITQTTPIPKLSSKPTAKPTQPISAISQLPPEILNSKIYFQKNSSVYEVSPLDSSPKVFLNADTYKFSPDLTKVAYIKRYELKGDFYILDLKTNQTKAYKADIETQRGLEWSPDGKYILVNIGTGPDGATMVFDVESGNKVGEFAQSGKLIWKDNETFFLIVREKVIAPRPWGAGDGASIAKRNIRTNEVQIILKADDLNDYRYAFYKNDCFYYTKVHVNNQSDWLEESKQEQTNYCYKVKTGEQKIATEEEVKDPDSELSKRLEKVFDIDPTKGNSVSFIKNDSFGDWIIVMPYTGGSIYKMNFYILNLQNPENTMTKIGQGASITWIK